MTIIVQKYGGSSLKDAGQRELVASKIVASKHAGYSVVVVVSAMGRRGDPYATDTLIECLEAQCADVDGREKDLIMSCGEIMSGVVLASLLNSRGEKAIPLTGFQGITDDFQITTLGRGGSDTTATALGAVLSAESVEIYTDVDGVMTVDPRVYRDARIIRELTYQEMGEMANEGAKVLHSRCVDLSRENNTPLWVKGTFSEDRGTHIHSHDTTEGGLRIVTGLIHRTGLREYILDLSPFQERAKLKRTLFETLAQDGVSLDLINLASDALYFTVDEIHAQKVEERLRVLEIPHECRTGVAKISSIGQGMKGTPGVMARVCDALHSRNIRIHRSVDSYINISCLIDAEDLTSAIEALHEKFQLGD